MVLLLLLDQPSFVHFVPPLKVVDDILRIHGLHLILRPSIYFCGCCTFVLCLVLESQLRVDADWKVPTESLGADLHEVAIASADYSLKGGLRKQCLFPQQVVVFERVNVNRSFFLLVVNLEGSFYVA